MSLESFCRNSVHKIGLESNTLEACHLMEQNNVGCLIVEESGKLRGILTDRDIALRIAGARKNPEQTMVRDIMTPDPIRVSVNSDVQHLTSLMHAYHVRRVPIVDRFDSTVGIVTVDDLIAMLGDEIAHIGKAISEEFARGNA